MDITNEKELCGGMDNLELEEGLKSLTVEKNKDTTLPPGSNVLAVTAEVHNPSNGSGDNNCANAKNVPEDCPMEKEKVKDEGTPRETEGAGGIDALLNHKFQTIASYMNLVSSKSQHSLLLQESTISGFLVLCLGDEDPEVVERTFEVFYALSMYPENIPLLKKLNYFMDALRCVAKNSLIGEQTRSNAKRVIAEIKSFQTKDCHPPLSELSNSAKNVLASNVDSITSAPAVDVKSVQKPVDLNTTMSTMKRKNKGRETILFIDDNVLQKRSDRALITQALIGKKGIISVTYDLKSNHCIVRGKRTVPPEDFGRAVAELGLAAVYLVRKNENKEEVKILIAAGDKENVQYPAYPEEVENEDIDSSTCVARTDQQRADDTSFLKSAKNFIKRSFYW